MSVDQKVLSKIQKLLSVAHGSAEGGEHERDTAMKMALNLLARHNLAMSDITTDTGKEKRVKEDSEFRDDAWAGRIVKAIAELYFCTAFKTAAKDIKKMRVVFIGLESNVATAQQMSKYVIQSIAKESRKHASKVSFRHGATQHLCKRCRDMRAEVEKNGAEENNTPSLNRGLALINVYKSEKEANALVLLENGIEIKKIENKTIRSTDDGSFHAGYQYGGKVGLNKQIG